MFEDIDLEKDGIIEASAGTGKTFTIKELVKRIIKVGRAKPEEILVLTFTEKATKELKARIREAIIKEKDKNENLRKATINFDRFNIFTIHGFCNFIIRNYPFDLSAPLNAEVSSVPYKILLNNLVLNEFEKLLEQRKNEKLNFEINKEIITPVLKIIETFSFEKGHRLRVEGYDREFKNSDEVLRFIKEGSISFEEKDFKGFVVYYFVLRLLEESENYKQKKWIITYDDMVEKVYKGLSENKAFLEKVSSLFKYIIIDEFQDTDLLQWKIFRMMKFASPSLRIYVVGDPKQAIYGFRGGDIHTYFKAKEEILKDGGKLYNLTKNYRSSISLINKLNWLFCDMDDGERKRWFENNGKHLHYEEVHGIEDKFNEENRFLNLKSLNLFKITAERAKEACKIWKSFVIAEISTLVRECEIKKSEILVLCKTSRNARDYEEALNKVGIKARFFDREGELFNTKEALNVKTLLSALAFPEDLSLKKSLLLSEIFNVDFREINEFLESEEGRKAAEIFDKWVSFARKKEWGKLFDSVYFESKMFERIFSENPTTEASSIVSRYNQLAIILKNYAYTNNLDIFSLALEFKKMIEEDKEKIWNEDTDFIKIMTIHSSKGLEAPIVFIGDGFTKKTEYPFYKYYSDVKKSYFYVIRTNGRESEDKKQTQIELIADEERLYYVAFTRAKYSVYAGVAELTSNRGGGRDIFCEWVKDWVIRKGLAEEIKSIEATNLIREHQEKPEVKPVFAPEIDFNRRSFMASFSRIKREEKDKETIIEVEISGEDEEIADVGLKLGGANFGKAVHEILEEIDFIAIGSYESMEDFINGDEFPLIKRHLERYFESVSEEDYKTVASMIYNTLRSKIKGDFSLSMIDSSKRMNEIDFYYKLDENLFLTGAIDLVFEYEGKFYIVDWKTNLLDNYEGEEFYKSVEDSYGLQYRIYTLATFELLKNIYPDPYEKLGGIFYIYLRGINGRNAGIFYRECPKDISRFREVVLNSYNEYLINTGEKVAT
ncbi:MAG: UvrD-helicase domain-containing protein [Brevinematia bacterium]